MARELLRSSNPALATERFERVAGEGVMTVQGTAWRASVLLALVIGSAGYTWSQLAAQPERVMTYVWGGFIGGLVLALVTMFKPRLAPWTSPIYAVVEGMALGGISMLYNASYAGLPVQAVGLTFSVFAVMLVLYATRIVKVTERFRSIMVAAVLGIMAFYLLSLVLGLFGVQIPLVHEGGPVGIAVSVVTTGVAALVLLLDFDRIEHGVRAGAPKFMEWYGAFGLLLTLVWLYLEILRLLSKLRD